MKNKPKAVSINGYNHPYNGTTFATGSYMAKEAGKL